MNKHWNAIPFILVLLIGACANAQVNNPSANAGGDGPHNFVSDRLYFGRNIPGGGAVSDSAWCVFLADVVTPRFPDGLTVWQAQGRWKDPQSHIEHETVMVVEVFHPADSPADSVFGAIAKTYRNRFRQDAVLRATEPVRMQMYDGTQH